MFLKENEKVAGGTGVYKKNKNLVVQGGEINSDFDFLGKINSIFPLNKSKNRAFSNIFLSFEYFVC